MKNSFKITFLIVLICFLSGCGGDDYDVKKIYQYSKKSKGIFELNKELITTVLPEFNIHKMKKEVAEKTKDFEKRRDDAYEKYIEEYNKKIKEIGCIKVVIQHNINPRDYNADTEILKILYYINTAGYSVPNRYNQIPIYLKFSEEENTSELYSKKLREIHADRQYQIDTISYDYRDYSYQLELKIQTKVSPNLYKKIYENKEKVTIETILCPLTYTINHIHGRRETPLSYAIKKISIIEKEGESLFDYEHK